MRLLIKYQSQQLIFIYLFIRHIPYSTTAGNKRDKKESTKKKRIGAEGETIHPNPGN